MSRIAFAIISCLAPATSPLHAADSKSQSPVRLEVSPKTIHLGGANRRQHILVTAVARNGELFDATHLAAIQSADARIAVIRNGRIVTGQSDGKTDLKIRYRNVSTTVPVVVSGITRYPPVNFRNDVIPIFSKLGCNSGGCHGKQSGQNGFRLSVFGSDPKADFQSLKQAARGRRVFPSAPEQSLLVRKAIGAVPHGGGKRTTPNSPDHRLLCEWIHQGMPWGKDGAPKLTGIEIEPRSRVLSTMSRQHLLVTAVYSDGSRRDVTDAAEYTSNAAVIAEAHHGGWIETGKQPGEAAITVNYMGQVGSVQVLVPRANAPSPYPQLAENNHVDRLVWAKLRKLGITPSDLCDDATFLRRLYLDAIGTLPTVKEVHEFLADKRKDKRRRAIDRVLNRPEFADYWALKFADVLLVNSEKLGERGAYQFHRWLRTQFAENRPYDEWVRELITATGDTGINGPANFYKALKTKEDLTRAISQAFLGVRLDCAQCHHHPFEKWGQEDFYGLAGFFNGLQRKKLTGDRLMIYHAGHRQTQIPIVNRPVPTKPPGGKSPEELADGDPRVRLAAWVTSPENPYFARLVANRIWKHYLGRGLVEPEDDLRSTNPPTNPELLDFLAGQLTQAKHLGGLTPTARPFDLKALMRLILNSRVYQLSSRPNETNADDTQNFSHYLVKRMPAEVLLDAVSQVTGSPEKFPGMPVGTRTIQLWDNRLPSYFLDTFGRSERESPCECGKSNDSTMAQALHLMNAPEIEEKIADKRGRIAGIIQAGKSQQEIVEELCYAVLGRAPGRKEKRIAAKLFAGRPKKDAAEDFLWALLNSYDFLFVR